MSPFRDSRLGGPTSRGHAGCPAECRDCLPRKKPALIRVCAASRWFDLVSERLPRLVAWTAVARSFTGVCRENVAEEACSGRDLNRGRISRGDDELSDGHHSPPQSAPSCNEIGMYKNKNKQSYAVHGLFKLSVSAPASSRNH